MGLKFSVSPRDLTLEAGATQKRLYSVQPQKWKTMEGGANFQGVSPRPATSSTCSSPIGCRKSQLSNRAEASNAAFGGAAAQAHSGTRPCASALLKAREGHRRGCGASWSGLCGCQRHRAAVGLWTGPVAERQRKQALTQLSNLPMSLKSRFSCVDHFHCALTSTN